MKIPDRGNLLLPYDYWNYHADLNDNGASHVIRYESRYRTSCPSRFTSVRRVSTVSNSASTFHPRLARHTVLDRSSSNSKSDENSVLFITVSSTKYVFALESALPDEDTGATLQIAIIKRPNRAWVSSLCMTTLWKKYNILRRDWNFRGGNSTFNLVCNCDEKWGYFFSGNL